MSGRLCSIAWPVFFARLSVPDEEPMQSRFADRDALSEKRVAEFEQGPVAMLGEPRHNLCSMRFGFTRISISTERARQDVTLAQLQISPAADACGTHAKTFGGFPMGRASANRSKHPNSKIDRKGFRLIRRPLSADSLNQTAPDLQNPKDSISQGTALERFCV